MALNGKYVKIGRILEGIYRDYGWQHELDWTDAVEWLGEAMDLIAVPRQYVEKITDGNDDLKHPCPIKIKNYRGNLPCDILNINNVIEGKNRIPMRHTTDIHHIGLQMSEAAIQPPASPPITSPLNVVKNNLTKDAADTDLTYKINDCYIFTNFPEGEVIMNYNAFPTDEDGLPLVPDNVKYIQAVKAYIAEKIGQKLWMQNKITGDKFQYLQRERDWYIGAATTAGLMPTVDEMQAWTNAFVRLIPNINQHGSNTFKYLGDQSKQIKHNSHR